MTKIFVQIIVTLVISTSSFAQVNYPVKFDKQDSTFSVVESCILRTGNDDLLLFWHEFVNYRDKILYSRSTDGGLTWNDKSILIEQLSISSGIEMDAILLNDGKILFTFKSTQHYLITSTDNGFSWSEGSVLPTRSNIPTRSICKNLKLALLSDGKIAAIYNFSSNGIYYIYSTDGITWSQFAQIDNKGIAGSLISLDDNKNLLVYSDSISNFWNLVFRTSTNAGITWSEKQVFHPALFNDTDPRIVKGTDRKIWIYFQREDTTVFPQFTQSEIYFITSTNNGLNWSQPEKFTNYRGNDFNPSVTLMNNIPMVCFVSERTFQGSAMNSQIFYGSEPDKNTPPIIFDIFHLPDEPVENQPVTIRAYVDDDTKVQSVKLVMTKNKEIPITLLMYDDGLKNDSVANDNIFGVIIPGLKAGDIIKYHCIAEDNFGNISASGEKILFIPLDFEIQTYRFENNRYKMPMNNSGVFADVLVNGIDMGRYDESLILFSGGFVLSGYDDDFLWVNGVFSASRFQDYLPGYVGSNRYDPKNNIYVINSEDLPFSESWQNYRYAVMIGAPFYDGDFDGEYIPVDKNNNGIWDEDEDAPEMLGDITAWCVFNDGVDPALRRLNDVYPLGIEIHQTVFSFNLNENNLPDEKIYVRYRIINRGTISSILDSVIFSFYIDPDIGEYYNDLSGCDTLINLGYSYSRGDTIFGINPPATGVALLQGPPVYELNTTFVDINNNGIFEPGIDTPLDSAIFKNGSKIPSIIFPGARNQGITSSSSMFASFSIPDPPFSDQYRNWQKGLGRFGDVYNPCDNLLGVVLGPVNCDEVNPIFHFSGDPVSSIGWISNVATDTRFFVNTGLFTLKKDEPVDIWGVYVAGRGEDSLQSIIKMKENTINAHNVYQQFPINEERIPPPILPDEYHLYQNYPNPFNPGTIIIYEIPIDNFVTIKIFDILGSEVKTLVNEFKPAGRYEVEFDGSEYASGVYFYQIKSGNYSRAMKMMLIK
jgi:hypothetical protein